jgi:hypothetical protein
MSLKYFIWTPPSIFSLLYVISAFCYFRYLFKILHNNICSHLNFTCTILRFPLPITLFYLFVFFRSCFLLRPKSSLIFVSCSIFALMPSWFLKSSSRCYLERQDKPEQNSRWAPRVVNKVLNRGLWKIAATVSDRYCRYSGRYSAAIATL